MVEIKIFDIPFALNEDIPALELIQSEIFFVGSFFTFPFFNTY